MLVKDMHTYESCSDGILGMELMWKMCMFSACDAVRRCFHQKHRKHFPSLFPFGVYVFYNGGSAIQGKGFLGTG